MKNEKIGINNYGKESVYLKEIRFYMCVKVFCF